MVFAPESMQGKVAVTAAVDNVSFGRPIKIGDVVTIEAQVTRAFNSSMEIYIEVFQRDIRSRSAKVKCNRSLLYFRLPWMMTVVRVLFLR